MNQENIATQMRKGIVEFCFLYILSSGELYPSEIIMRLENAGLSLKEATAYTVLNRLKKDGKVTFRWCESPKGPPRKYFALTERGRTALDLARMEWNLIQSTILNLYKQNNQE